jgi:large subunit ribosomal protein L31e
MTEKAVKGKKAVAEKKAEEKEVKNPKPEKPAAKDKKEEKAAPSKTYVIPLDRAFSGCRTRRAKSAVRILREFLRRHVPEEAKIDSSVNEFINSRGRCSIPRRVKVVVSKEADKMLVKLAE